jgi:hypothetical protein
MREEDREEEGMEKECGGRWDGRESGGNKEDGSNVKTGSNKQQANFLLNFHKILDIFEDIDLKSDGEDEGEEHSPNNTEIGIQESEETRELKLQLRQLREALSVANQDILKFKRELEYVKKITGTPQKIVQMIFRFNRRWWM